MVPLGEVLIHYKEYIDSPEARIYPKLSVKLYENILRYIFRVVVISDHSQHRAKNLCLILVDYILKGQRFIDPHAHASCFANALFSIFVVPPETL